MRLIHLGFMTLRVTWPNGSKTAGMTVTARLPRMDPHGPVANAGCAVCAAGHSIVLRNTCVRPRGFAMIQTSAIRPMAFAYFAKCRSVAVQNSAPHLADPTPSIDVECLVTISAAAKSSPAPLLHYPSCARREERSCNCGGNPHAAGRTGHGRARAQGLLLRRDTCHRVSGRPPGGGRTSGYPGRKGH